MAFTVSRTAEGAKDAEYVAYTRLLRQQGADLGKMQRAPEPKTHRRWLPVWSEREAAQDFANALVKRTGDNAWTVVEVAMSPSEGPIGPLVVQVGRRSTGLVFEVHPLGRMLIQSAYPGKQPRVTTASIEFETLQEFTSTHGSIAELATQILPSLTGLDSKELNELGYVLIEDNTQRTLVFVPPADLPVN